jgi:hypothetical protein
MKKQLLLLSLGLCLFSGIKAQVGTGLFAGGGLGFSVFSSEVKNGSTTVKGPVVSVIKVNPRIGYFLTDNFALGVDLGYWGTFSTYKNGVEEKTSLNTIGIGLFGRYAFNVDEESKFFIYTDFNVGFSSTTGKTEVGSVSFDTDPISNVIVGIAPGIMYFPTPKIGLEASLGNLAYFDFQTTTDADDSEQKENEISLRFLDLSSIGLNLGLHYYFNR